MYYSILKKLAYKLPIIALLAICSCNPVVGDGIRKKDLSRDVLLETTKGDILLRLYPETPLHRDNFIRLVKRGFYDSIQFHRVINHFMIQAGDPMSKKAGSEVQLGEADAGYTIPAEFRSKYFHHKGVLAAARTGDDINPQKASSGSQFYIVQGKTFTDAGLDSVEISRLNGRKIPPEQRAFYKSIGGTPHLDQGYTIFGEVISGLGVVDSIAAVKTTGDAGGDRPIQPVRINKARLISH
jgi:peptidyl-prolyl cis-trans isomerase B (cyclophilin B)